MSDKRNKSHVSRQGRGNGPGGGPGGMGMMMGEKPKEFKKTIKKLLIYLKPYYIHMILVMVFAIGSTVFSIVSPKVMGDATQIVFVGAAEKLKGGIMDFSGLGQKIILLGALYLISALLSGVQQFIMAGVSQKITYKLRKEMSEKVNRLPLKYFDKRTHGEVLSRITNDVDVIGQSLSQILSQLTTSVFTILGVMVMMFSISVWMTLVSLLIIPISLGLVMLIIKKSQKYFRQQQEFVGQANGLVEEVYSGHSIVKAFNAEKEMVNSFYETNDSLYKTAWKSQFLSGVMMPAMHFVGNLGYVVVCILGGLLAVRNMISVGNILSFITYVRNFTHPITQAAQIANIFQSTAAAAERVFEFLGEEEEKDLKEATNYTKNIAGNVSFKNVKFGYDEDKTIIHDFSADISAGQRIAIVGPTGAGKTTLVKLLVRFYELNGGSISVDGRNITDFSRDDLRAAISMVLQDAWLFNGSIMENIRYGKLDATDQEVVKAAKAANADFFIKTLPGNYDFVLNEETSNVSQGQKQLLTIARAILANPKILILDEATSSVDTRTEVLIQKAMETLMKGRTSFIIAHRLSTIRDADLILVLSDGDIVEQGKHRELLDKNGFYASLYNSQFA